MATATRAPKQRTLRLTRTGDSLALVIRERQGQGKITVNAYFLEPLSDGTGFILAKDDGTRYTTRPVPGTCTCRGHQTYGHVTVCKHVAALRRLTELGRL